MKRSFLPVIAAIFFTACGADLATVNAQASGSENSAPTMPQASVAIPASLEEAIEDIVIDINPSRNYVAMQVVYNEIDGKDGNRLDKPYRNIIQFEGHWNFWRESILTDQHDFPNWTVEFSCSNKKDKKCLTSDVVITKHKGSLKGTIKARQYFRPERRLIVEQEATSGGTNQKQVNYLLAQDFKDYNLQFVRMRLIDIIGGKTKFVVSMTTTNDFRSPCFQDRDRGAKSVMFYGTLGTNQKLKVIRVVDTPDYCLHNNNDPEIYTVNTDYDPKKEDLTILFQGTPEQTPIRRLVVIQ